MKITLNYEELYFIREKAEIQMRTIVNQKKLYDTNDILQIKFNIWNDIYKKTNEAIQEILGE